MEQVGCILLGLALAALAIWGGRIVALTWSQNVRTGQPARRGGQGDGEALVSALLAEYQRARRTLACDPRAVIAYFTARPPVSAAETGQPLTSADLTRLLGGSDGTRWPPAHFDNEGGFRPAS